ncbi:MAG: hydrogenase maturation nickel metallochaperone HypA [Myxococcota bacterium]
MHELSIVRNIVALVDERAAGRRVKRVDVEIGKLSGIDVRAVNYCFGMCAEGTSLSDATLVIDEVEGSGRCEACNKEVHLERPLGVCPCERRARLRIERGEELRVRSMEV